MWLNGSTMCLNKGPKLWSDYYCILWDSFQHEILFRVWKMRLWFPQSHWGHQSKIHRWIILKLLSVLSSMLHHRHMKEDEIDLWLLFFNIIFGKSKWKPGHILSQTHTWSRVGSIFPERTSSSTLHERDRRAAAHPTPKPSPQLITLHHLDLHGIAA